MVQITCTRVNTRVNLRFKIYMFNNNFKLTIYRDLIDLVLDLVDSVEFDHKFQI